MRELREYQTKAIDMVRDSIRSGKRRPILAISTGGGKTIVACEIMRTAVEKGSRVLFMAPRRELVLQACDSLYEHGLDSGIIMAGVIREPHKAIQIASFDTLQARAVRTKRMPMPEADLVIVDEGRLSIANTRKNILGHYSDKIIIALDASPCRSDGRGLGEIYDDILVPITMGELIDQGHLLPVRYFAPSKPDLSKLKTNKGDYVVKELEKRVDKPKLVGEIVSNWKKIAPDRQTIVYCVTRSHGRHVHDEFQSAGVKVGYLDGDTKPDERAEVLDDICSGKIQVLVNIFVCTYGFDAPAVSCIVLARPTKNISLYLQTVGRGMRPYPNQEDMILIDHSGAVQEHGFVDEPIPWSLDNDIDIREAKKKEQKEKSEPKEITCKNCRYIFKARRDCPRCGFEMIPTGKPIPVHKADLKEMSRPKAKKEDKQRVWTASLYKASHLNMKVGAAAHLYRKEIGVWPRGLDMVPNGSQWQMQAKEFLEQFRR